MMWLLLLHLWGHNYALLGNQMMREALVSTFFSIFFHSCCNKTILHLGRSKNGSVTYGVAEELAKILKPLVGKSPHHINSTQDFVEQAKHFKLEAGECLSSYDVSFLFTSVPIDPALNIIKDLLVKDDTLKERTVMEVGDIILLLEFCLKNTYFSFQGQFYEQVEGAASQPHCSQLIHGVLGTKSSKYCPHPPSSGAGM